MSGRRNNRGRGRGRRNVNRRVVPIVPQPVLDNPLVVERLAHFTDITGTGQFNAVRTAINPLTIKPLIIFAAAYSEYRFSFLRFIVQPVGPSTSLGSIFLSYDLNFTTTAAPKTFDALLNRENVLVTTPSNSSSLSLTHREAFQRDIYGGPGHHLTVPRGIQVNNWLLVNDATSTAPFIMVNYGSDLLQQGLMGARIFVSFRCIFRGAQS